MTSQPDLIGDLHGTMMTTADLGGSLVGQGQAEDNWEDGSPNSQLGLGPHL